MSDAPISAAAEPDEIDEHEKFRLEVWREAVTMALYLSLSLLAVLVAMPIDGETPASLARAVALTSLGLMAAHIVAFRMSSKLVHGEVNNEAVWLIGAQLAGGIAITVIAVIPMAFFDTEEADVVAAALMTVFIAVVGYLTVRLRPASRLRAVLYTGVVVAIAAAVVQIKNLVH